MYFNTHHTKPGKSKNYKEQNFFIIYTYLYTHRGFHGVSDGKESACNIGDPRGTS